MKSHIIAALSCAVFTLGSQAAIADEWDKLAIKDKIDDAKNELKKASAAGFEWRDSGKLLKKAEKASNAGDYTKAEKLIAQATRQAHLAVAQAEAQKDAGPH